MSPIFVTLGKKRYVGGTITDVSGKDISAATYTIALSLDPNTPPATFANPDVSTQGTTTASRKILKLVDNTVTPGIYYCWGNILDTPEIEPMVLQGPITVI